MMELIARPPRLVQESHQPVAGQAGHTGRPLRIARATLAFAVLAITGAVGAVAIYLEHTAPGSAQAGLWSMTIVTALLAACFGGLLVWTVDRARLTSYSRA